MEDAVESQLRDLISRNLKVNPALIVPGSKLSEWGGDSLLFLETIFEVESHFDIQCPDVGKERTTDFDALVALVKRQLALNGSDIGTDAAV